MKDDVVGLVNGPSESRAKLAGSGGDVSLGQTELIIPLGLGLGIFKKLTEPIVNDMVGVVWGGTTVDTDDWACCGGGKVADKWAVRVAEPSNDGVETGKEAG